MLSQPSPPNSHGFINPEQPSPRTDTYTLIALNNNHYRVLNRQFQSQINITYLWCVFWMLNTLVIATILIVNQQNTHILVAFGSLFVAALALMGFIIYNHKYLMKLVMFSSINMSAYTACILILVALDLKFISAPTLTCIVIQIVLSVIYVKHKGRIILELIILTQLGLIGLKADDLIESSWAQIIIPLTPILIFLIAALLFISFYSILLCCSYPDTFKSKKYILIFLVLLLLSFASVIGIPVTWAYFSWNPFIMCIPALGASSTTATFLWLYSNHIALFFCKHKQQIIQGQKQLKYQLIPIQIANKKKHLFRFAQNWFGYQLSQSTEIDQSMKSPECLICTQHLSDVVWMPCGHLALCSPCSKDMLQNSMLSCVLCKQKPVQICKIKQKNSTQQCMDKEMGLSDELLKPNQFQILQQFAVRITN